MSGRNAKEMALILVFFALWQIAFLIAIMAPAPAQPSAEHKIVRDEGSSRRKHRHAIPRILVFTYKRDLLNEPIENLADEEEIVLKRNVEHSIQMNDPSRTIFLTDGDCIESLRRVLPELVPHFRKESKGMFKADICRGSALWEHGGIYLDVDVGVRTDLWLDLLPETEFFTAKVHGQSRYSNNFFQAVLGSTPRNPIMMKYLELFLDHYTGRDVVENGPLGVQLLRRAWDRVYDQTTNVPATELYQEYLYKPNIFGSVKPAPTWGGKKRACHFLVVARANDPKNAEQTIRGDVAIRFPFYSRIGGSRMCPVNGSSAKEEQ